MKKVKRIWLILGILALCLGGAYWYFVPAGKMLDDSAILPGYVKYHTDSTIVFAQNGNSAEYVSSTNGWGGQEPKHRCIVGKKAELKLFVADYDGSDMRLIVNAAGVYSPESPCQKITVFVNDTVVADWCAASRDEYSAIIPATLIKDANLDIQFHIAAPYVSSVDVRPLGAAVREIYLEKIRGNQTKKKLSLWIQKKMWGGPVENPYNTNSEPKQVK